jgi:Protein of unknown function (DUF2690)
MSLLLTGLFGGGIGSILIMQATPASAAGCNGSGCAGKNPDTMGCTGSTIESKTIGGAAGPQTLTIQLRRAGNCTAFWARAVRDDCAYPAYTYIKEQQQLWTTYGWYDLAVQYKQLSGSCNGGTTYTNMNPDRGDDRHRACIAQSLSGPVNPATIANWNCTAYHS